MEFEKLVEGGRRKPKKHKQKYYFSAQLLLPDFQSALPLPQLIFVRHHDLGEGAEQDDDGDDDGEDDGEDGGDDEGDDGDDDNDCGEGDDG